MRKLLISCAWVAIAGCASAPATRPSIGRSEAAAAESLVGRATLAEEQKRFSELFSGTPVVFSMQGDGSLRVAVPLRFSFDKGRRAVKPPLGAVLDRIARSQRREATRFLIAAPPDAGSKGLLLATDRATSTRDYLVARGVEATRFTVSALGSGDTVSIVIIDGAPH